MGIIKLFCPFESLLLNILFFLFVCYILYSIGKSLYVIVTNYKKVKQYNQEIDAIEKKIVETKKKLKDAMNS
ncbi:MAG: hypothetical protein DKM50_11000 [Candidatus Margulisiibacteriota bacterium]|nr:MAG: hypothetical protein A2X43_07810 [Candidatus Margulisbacteria bacterium GWD2_39_127]OGI03872.1 MAG: hypothetical protein A2X42_09925 [Candidatus Margulisbacteria bacterium GWF2_38_17]OGI08823.1 MAG: hypothetical protein A2X41_05190 [Candidatus Margulisbacteria bacterium GWE2_39_32]PZM78654.1 MAG: hypothetical protein DKM50_11000 [Candidatus Margulisiibacteriota bacterium]HAR61996.1 hypothetical protein [Candidatus Margulisiibacteriota bacterium]